MELILNDFSMHGQFETMEQFEDYFVQELNPLLDTIIVKEIPLYKKTNTYARNITSVDTLGSLLQQSNKTIGTILKKKLIQMAYAEPYWDNMQIRTDFDAIYHSPIDVEIPNCFTEALERQCPLVSLASIQCNIDPICVIKNEQHYEVRNIQKKAKLLEVYLLMHPEEIRFVLEELPFTKRVKLIQIDDRCYAEEALLESGLNEDDLQKVIHNIPNLITDIMEGRKSHWWDHIEDDIYEYRVTISGSREFRLLFVWEKDILFLNGFIKKTQSTPKGEKSKARDIVRKYRGQIHI